MDSERIRELEGLIAGEYSGVTGVVVRKSGEVAYEAYFNGYAAGDAVHVYSVTKSVVSALIGIAVDRGLISGVERKVLDFFPEYAVLPGEKTIRSITIQNLLTMTAPYKYDVEPYEAFFASPNPIKDALDLLGGDKPIGEFNYSAVGGTHLLSGILARATGRSVRDFAVENLFAPLGIDVPRDLALRTKEEHIAVMQARGVRGWAVDPAGLNAAGWGLFLTPDDMARIGQLYLNGGTWDGERIVSSRWVEESTNEHSRCVRWGDMAYGYLWWLPGGDSYAALGDGGNAIYVDRKKDLVVSVAALLAPDAKDSVELIKGYIEPAFAG
ncbi:MAG: serine hydrolase [Spirochaetae bacterium HGW-Spirochaetae-3]|jgi:CubicO group peptidase (beta-lactamase class C family)|nr:MAG: serine hydrolase [Spirochaetae bacterium HGW-Spirochaetae-3]